MRHSRRMGWPSAVIGLLVLAFGSVGVGLAGVADHSAGRTVTVTLTDTKLVVSHGVLEAGQATFVVTNKGHKPHVVSISGPGLSGGKTRQVQAGASASLTVTLRMGAYMLADRVRLGSSNVRWLAVGPAAKSTGSSREVVPFPPPAPMDCD